jgi:hypothetical protein
MVTELKIQIIGEDLDKIYKFLLDNKEVNIGDNWQVLNSIEFKSDVITVFGECKDDVIDTFWIELSIDNTIYIEYVNSYLNSGIFEIINGEVEKMEVLPYYNYLYYYDNDYFWNEIEFKSESLSLDELMDIIGDFYYDLSDEDKDIVYNLHANNYKDKIDEF